MYEISISTRRMKLVTVKRSGFYLTCRDDLEEHGIWLATVVESVAQNDKRLVEGETFQVGWSVLKLVKTASGLALCEPDFDGDPFCQFRNDVSATLAVIREQRELLGRVTCTPVDFRFDDKVVVFKGCLDEPGIYAQRSQPRKDDSGWYVGPTRKRLAPTANDLESIWAYQLLHKRPQLLAAMCLPPGWMVVWDGADIRGIANEDNQEVMT